MKIKEAGGVVFCRDGPTRYLLVTARTNPDEWIFPKGHLEPGESAQQAAVREVREEAGVEATPVAPLGRLEFRQQGSRIEVVYWLLKYRRTLEVREDRRLRWCSLDEALEILSFEDARRMLAQVPAMLERL